MNNIKHQEMVKRTVRAKFHGHDTLQSKTIPAYPISAEREFRRITNGYMKLLNRVLRENLPAMMSAYKKERHGDSRFDDSQDLDGEVRQLIQKMAAELERALAEYGLDEQIRKISTITKDTSLREWKRAVKNILVSVVSESPFFRTDKKSVTFRGFLEAHDAEVYKLDAGAFHESGTEIPTRLVKIRK